MLKCDTHDFYACDINTHRRRQKLWAAGVDKALKELGVKHQEFSSFCSGCPAARRSRKHEEEMKAFP